MNRQLRKFNKVFLFSDVLSRESQRRRRTKSVSSTSSVAPDFSKAPGPAWKQRSSIHDFKKQNRTKPGAILQQNSNPNGASEEQGGTKSLSKQVSFKERLAEEIPQDKGDNETATSTPKQKHREHQRSTRDHDASTRGKNKENRDRSGTRSSSKDRNRSSSRDRHDKSKSSGKSSRKESLEREPKVEKNDGSGSPRKSKRFKMPDFKNLLPGKKVDKQKVTVINAFGSKTGHTVIASDDDTDREGRSISCLSTGRSNKHKYHEPSSTDVTSDESDFFRNSPNTVDLLTVCIDNEIPAHRYASQKVEKVTKLKRTSSLLSAVDGEKARATHGVQGQSQGHQKKDSVSSVSSAGTLAPPITSITNRGQNIIEIISNEKGGDASPRSSHDRPEDRLQGPLKFAYEGNLQKLVSESNEKTHRRKSKENKYVSN